MQELGKLDCKINMKPNELEEYVSFNISNKLVFIDSFQFLSPHLDSLLKNFDADDFTYLSQEFDSKVLYSDRQKGFYPYEYMSGFEKFKERLRSKEKFRSLLKDKKLVIKSMSIALRFGIDLK